MMTEFLQFQPRDRVLEVGTGSGYQSAILAELLPQGQLVTVELVPVLRERAQCILNGLGNTSIVIESVGETLACPARGPSDAYRSGKNFYRRVDKQYLADLAD